MPARVQSWRCLAILIVCCSVQAGAASDASAQEPRDGTGSYRLGTATTGGTYHPVGVALSTLVKLKLLPTFGVDLTAINTDGSQENLDLIRENDIQFAIISAMAGHEARTGTGAFSDAGADDDLRAITTLWLSTDHLLIRDDAVASGTIADFLDLKGRPVSLGRRNSSTLLENRTLMSAFGIDIDTDFEQVELGFSESAEALASNRIDGMSVSGGVPIGAVQDAFETLGDGVVALEINDEQLAQIDGNRGIWQRVVIPSGTYPGQDRDISTIGTPNILAVRADVDEEVVYQITRTIFDELDYLHGLHSTTRQISLDNAVSSLPIAVHAGAARYFEEKGVELPPPPIRLDPDLLVRYPTSEEAITAANQGVVTMFGGTEGDTSSRIAAELATVLNAGDGGIRLLATNGGGVGRNLTDLLYLKGVDTALVRADMINYARDQAVYPSLEGQVNYISEMFPEEVHLLVGGDIDELDDLTGRKVNVGTTEAGAGLTASIVLSELGLRAEMTRFEPRMAIEKLKQGEIAGAIFVGGKPMPLLRQIERDAGLKLIALPAVDYLDSYRTAEIPGQDYPNLMQPDDVVETIAVRTALLTYAWQPDSARYQALGDLSGLLFDNLLELQEGGYHPKWREVDPTAEFASWRRFEPAGLWIEANQDTALKIADEGRLRMERQGAGQPDAAPVAAPVSIPDTVRSDPAPGDQSEVPAQRAATPQEEAADTTDIPTAPVVELTPTEELSIDGIDLNAAGAAQAAESEPKLPSVPKTRVNTPTF